ncbi:hypothetical protein WJX82_004900 [Trebouxia sp. C0006]
MQSLQNQQVQMQATSVQKDQSIRQLNAKVIQAERDLRRAQDKFQEEKVLLTNRETELLKAKADSIAVHEELKEVYARQRQAHLSVSEKASSCDEQLAAANTKLAELSKSLSQQYSVASELRRNLEAEAALHTSNEERWCSQEADLRRQLSRLEEHHASCTTNGTVDHSHDHADQPASSSLGSTQPLASALPSREMLQQAHPGAAAGAGAEGQGREPEIPWRQVAGLLHSQGVTDPQGLGHMTETLKTFVGARLAVDKDRKETSDVAAEDDALVSLLAGAGISDPNGRGHFAQALREHLLSTHPKHPISIGSQRGASDALSESSSDSGNSVQTDVDLQHSRKVSVSRLRKSTTVAGPKGINQPSLEARVLSGILKTSDVPYSSYVPEPRTFLHSVSAVVKEIWLLALLVYMARASAVMRLSIAAGCALLTAIALPPRLWKPQLRRLGLLALLLFVFTAIGSDGVPPMLQQRHPPTALEGLPGMPRPAQSYRYVILHLWIITITRRSISLGIAAASLTFVAFQSASLCLTCTPAEELAVALRTLLRPLAILRVPVNEIGLTLLLSLRFMSLVFEEVRNLSLGLAARGIDWNGLGPAGGIQVLIRLGGRLFSNLMQRSDSIAQAMCSSQTDLSQELMSLA